MLVGIGADILQIERFRRSLARFGRGYLEEVFSEEELARSWVPANLTEAAFFARAFCAKEACAKALGTGIDETVDWYDISVDQVTLPATIALFGGAIARLEALTPIGFQSVISLDIGSKNGLARACVMISVVHQDHSSSGQLNERRL
ncbi:4'-phosphopantetheinyl transferase superfamily protein [Sphingosinicella sp. CPCC 101087]|uniref:4'-phosphopantetheinyl transferase superfamily protein n=1 Tax=Sphingosinicella sp. CPCC 101087 TaxID=2497754 RepID=UPI00101CEEB6|nr:4'-phosphopantetheinyl transferase superfamily protein [Sphingosinicella sp. CPCC 101087]